MNETTVSGTRVVRRKRRPRVLLEAPRRASARKFGDHEDAMIELVDANRAYWKARSGGKL